MACHSLELVTTSYYVLRIHLNKDNLNIYLASHSQSNDVGNKNRRIGYTYQNVFFFCDFCPTAGILESMASSYFFFTNTNDRIMSGYVL